MDKLSERCTRRLAGFTSRRGFLARLGLALVAAQALARMGEPGTHQLTATISGPDRRAAAIALEALEHATVGAT